MRDLVDGEWIVVAFSGATYVGRFMQPKEGAGATVCLYLDGRSVGIVTLPEDAIVRRARPEERPPESDETGAET